MSPKTAIAIGHVSTCWGSDAPDWLTALAEACDRSTQADVAKDLGCSAALINSVLKRRYGVDGFKGDLTAIERKVRALLMAETVNCPALGELSKTDCREWQDRPYANTNALRVQMYRACSACTNKGGV